MCLTAGSVQLVMTYVFIVCRTTVAVVVWVESQDVQDLTLIPLFFSQLNSISKAITSTETPVKEKHARRILNDNSKAIQNLHQWGFSAQIKLKAKQDKMFLTDAKCKSGVSGRTVQYFSGLSTKCPAALSGQTSENPRDG